MNGHSHPLIRSESLSYAARHAVVAAVLALAGVVSQAAPPGQTAAAGSVAGFADIEIDEQQPLLLIVRYDATSPEDGRRFAIGMQGHGFRIRMEASGVVGGASRASVSGTMTRTFSRAEFRKLVLAVEAQAREPVPRLRWEMVQPPP
jgi:hypothetical protein